MVANGLSGNIRNLRLISPRISEMVRKRIGSPQHSNATTVHLQ